MRELKIKQLKRTKLTMLFVLHDDDYDFEPCITELNKKNTVLSMTSTFELRRMKAMKRVCEQTIDRIIAEIHGEQDGE
ncbi:MAG: hypothetical protein GWN93_26785 [Deltaproteobacteria bacterium]|nr:hypothetical protein [Deltaproteobacteria bacterium]